MPDSAISDAVRDQLFNRLGMILGAAREYDLQVQFNASVELNRVRSRIVGGDETGVRILDLNVTRVKIRAGDGSGILDADAEGLTFGRIVDGLGGTNHQIKFFNDQDRTVLVAQTPATVNDNATGTFTPQAGFFLAGSIDIGPIVADVDFVIQTIPPLFRRIDDEFDGTLPEDEDLRQRLKAAVNTARGRARSAATLFRTQAGQLVSGAFADRFVTGSTTTSLIERNLRRQPDGSIIEEPVGRLEDVRDGMALNTAGAGVIDLQEQVETAVVAFPGTFQGTGSAVATTDMATAGPLEVVCTKGLDATPPDFEVRQTPDDSRLRGEPSFIATPLAENRLRLQKVWKDHLFGINSFTLDYLALPANETGTPISVVAADWTVASMTSGNSDGGKLWIRYDLATDELRFFSSETFRDNNDPNGIVATASAPGVASVFVTPAGPTGLVVTGKTGAALNDADAANVDFQAPVAGPVASRFTITVSVTTEPGLMQAAVRKGGIGGAQWRLHSTSSPNLPDGQVRAGFPQQARLFGDND